MWVFRTSPGQRGSEDGGGWDGKGLYCCLALGQNGLRESFNYCKAVEGDGIDIPEWHPAAVETRPGEFMCVWKKYGFI